MIRAGLAGLALVLLPGVAMAQSVGLPAAARNVEIEQLSPVMVGRGRLIEDQTAVRGPADSSAANLATREQGRPPASAAIGGQDRCDAAAGRPACTAVIENRASEFARPTAAEIPGGLGIGELLQQGQRGAFLGAPATAGEAASVLSRQAAPSPVSPDPAQQAVVNAIVQGTGR